jgi:hypothetical protein
MNINGIAASAAMATILPTEFVPLRLPTPKPGNHRSQATRRREIRRRSNLPKAMQKRLGFKCH